VSFGAKNNVRSDKRLRFLAGYSLHDYRLDCEINENFQVNDRFEDIFTCRKRYRNITSKAGCPKISWKYKTPKKKHKEGFESGQVTW
jgi:hypothetical protein